MSLNLRDTFQESASWANQVEAHADLQKRKDLDYARSDMNTDVGRISLSHDDEEHSKLNKVRSKQKKRAEEILRKILQDIIKQAQAIAADIYNDINDYKESVDRQNCLRAYKQNGDTDALREMFINEYHMNAEDVAAMSDEEILAQADKLDEVEQSKQAMLIESIKLKIQDFEKHIENGDLPQQQREELQRALDKIKQDAQKETGVNYDEAYAKAHQSDMQNGKLYKIGRGEEISENADSRTARQSNEAHMENAPLPNPGGLDF